MHLPVMCTKESSRMDAVEDGSVEITARGDVNMGDDRGSGTLDIDLDYVRGDMLCPYIHQAGVGVDGCTVRIQELDIRQENGTPSDAHRVERRPSNHLLDEKETRENQKVVHTTV